MVHDPESVVWRHTWVEDPVDLQESLVQDSESLQETASPPPQEPLPLQVSPVVQPLPSSQEAELDLFVQPYASLEGMQY